MSKVRINDLAREMEVKSKQILDIIAELGMAAGKTHSSSLEEYEADKVARTLSAERGRRACQLARPRAPRQALRPRSISRISPSRATC